MREPWIDRAKGMLIVLMVFGHLVGTAGKLATGSADCYNALWKLVYLFHMPAFFVLAGVLWRRPLPPFRDFLVAKARHLMVPYYAFGAFSLAVYSLMTAFAPGCAGADGAYYAARTADSGFFLHLRTLLLADGAIGGEGFKFNSVLWFLPCYFSTQVVFYALNRLFRGSFAALAVVSAALFAADRLGLCRPLACLPLELAAVPRYLVFVTLGTLVPVAPFAAGARPTRPRLVAEAVGALALYFAFALFAPSYHELLFTPAGAFASLPLAVMGTMALLLAAIALPSRLFASLGAASLWIMMLHRFALSALQLKLPGVAVLYRDAPLAVSLAVSSVILAVTVAGCVFARAAATRLLKEVGK